ncbi:MAG: hypothetical protein JRI23_09435 [Deltaproteobacteria bacterium]|nr:hypothetical protein [Deltaproteobacteria bacterium]MBW2531871.1 hypothetical protein [Deltaproteobacteria bacterium]
MRSRSVRRTAALLGCLIAAWLLVGPEADSEARPGARARRWGKKPAPPPQPIVLERVSEVGGARWSSTLGFVAEGEAPASDGAAPAGNIFVPAVNVPEG